MELASIINQYYDAFIVKYADTALRRHLMPFVVAAHLIPVNSMCSVLTVITHNGNLCPADTVVTQDVKTI
jgi:hypothetical protein